MHRKKRMLIVDGYNVLNAWRSDLGGATVNDAREELTHRLIDYAGYSAQKVVVVYDAYLADRRARSQEEYGPVRVVFTQKGETADQYIERLTDSLWREIDLDRIEVRVATSDLIEQTVVMGRGAARMSARELIAEMQQVRSAGRTAAAPALRGKGAHTTVMEHLPEEIRLKLERMRLQ